MIVAVPPAWEPVSVPEVRAQAKIDGTDDDALIARYIRTAREWCEKRTGRRLPEQTLELRLSGFESRRRARAGLPAEGFDPHVPGRILLPGPVLEVQSVTYNAVGGAVTILPAAYFADLDEVPATLEPISDAGVPGEWPTFTAAAVAGAVTIRYRAGYAAADQIPDSLVTWILLVAASLIDHRGYLLEEQVYRSPLEMALRPWKVRAL